MDDAVLIMCLEFIATAVAAKIDTCAVDECGLGRIGRRCLHIHDCTPGVRAKDCLGIVKIVVLVFEIIAGPRARIASSRKVGSYRTVFKANARDDGTVRKVKLFRFKCDGLCRRNIGFP